MAIKDLMAYAGMKFPITGAPTQEQVSTAVDSYLERYPVTPGASEAEAAQIEANETAIAEINEGYVKDVNVSYSLTTTIDSEDYEWVTTIPTPTAEKPYMWVWIGYTKRSVNANGTPPTEIVETRLGEPALVGVFTEPVTEEDIAAAVEAYMAEHPVSGGSDSDKNVDLTGYVQSVNGVTPDENGNVEISVSGGSGGMSSAARSLLISILRNAVFTSDQSANITALESALASGGDSGGGGTVAGTYSVINGLTNVTNSNEASAVLENGSYVATLTADDGYFLDTVTVMMGGEDVTASVYLNGTITISSVTGDIVITATAVTAADSGVVAYWDFTKSLVDTVGGVEVTLKNATQDENGLHFTASGQMALTHVDIMNRTVEVVVGEVDSSSHSGHGRFICFSSADDINSSGYSRGLVWHNTGCWAVYLNGWNDTENTDKMAVANSVIRMKTCPYNESNFEIAINNQIIFNGLNDCNANKLILCLGSNTTSFYSATILSVKIYEEVQE